MGEGRVGCDASKLTDIFGLNVIFFSTTGTTGSSITLDTFGLKDILDFSEETLGLKVIFSLISKSGITGCSSRTISSISCCISFSFSTGGTLSLVCLSNLYTKGFRIYFEPTTGFLTSYNPSNALSIGSSDKNSSLIIF